MSNLRIRLRVGPDYSRGGARQKGFSATKGEASKLVEEVVRPILTKAADAATDRLLAALPGVQQDLYTDIDYFAQTAMRFMFSRQSSTVGNDLQFMLNFPTQSGRGSAIPFISGGIAKIPSGEVQMAWKALSKSMLTKKKPNTTYFVFTGQLKWELLDEGVFSQFMKDVLKPGIKYQVIEEEAPVTKQKHTVGRLSVFVAASKKGQNLANMPFLKTGVVSPGDDQTLIARYMGEEIANKLTNARHPQNKRAFASPLLGYWVLKRFPFVVESSIKRRLKLGYKNNGTADTFSVRGA